MSATTFERVSMLLGKALIPLGDLTSDPQIALRTLSELGWQSPPGVDIAAVLSLDVEVLADRLVAVLGATTEEREDPAIMTPLYAQLIAEIGDLLVRIDAMAAALPAVLANAGDYAAKTQIASELPRRLLDRVIFGELTRVPQIVPAAFALMGVMRLERYPRDDSIYQTAHDRAVVDWGQLGRILSEPGQAIAGEYGWGTDAFASDRLLPRIGAVLASLGARAVTIVPPGQPGPSPTRSDVRLLLERGPGLPPAPIGLEAHRLEPGASAPSDGGLVVTLHAGVGGTALELTDELTLKLTSDLELAGGVELHVRPSGVALVSEAVSVTGGLTVGIHYGVAGGAPRDLLSAPGGLRVVVGEAFVEIGGRSEPDNDPDAWVRVGILDCKLTVTTAAGDGFLQKTMPPEFGAGFDVILRWSRRSGLAFEGAGTLELTVPVQQPVGPLVVDSIRIMLDASADGLRLVAGASTGLSLGPLKANVANLGLEGTLTPVKGNMGPVDLALGFKPPDGAGLSIDAGAVTGGGFLFFDPKNEQYAGGLHLEFEGGLNLNAIGLLTTRMPDGSRGFSLLVIVQASGFAPIQLGFGFTLNGVGGLLAINRTVAVDVLRAGVRNKTLDAVLSSKDDPTPRAPQIVSTLQTVFPPAPNQYVFGPMALIGWGTPTLLTIEIALILELPAPLRLIVLGRLRAALPDPEHAIVSINLDVLGVIDFDRGELSVDATLYDSRVGPFALTGDMAARASWGTTPDFAMALGGFHPAYKPPPGFPELRRLALALSTGNNPRVRMEAYFALTSNTVQVGARLELYVEAAGFSLEGGLGFDTLIQFSPFRLLAEIYARLALKRGSTTLMGLNIHVHLIGPAPWVLWGEASFKLLFISISIPFRATIGQAEETPAIERVEVWPKLEAELGAPTSWTAQLPPDGGRLVVLRGEAGGGEVLAHPLGSLAVSQRVVPLERALELFGAVPPKDFDRFEITGAAGLGLGEKTSDHFPPAQFRRMNDAQKLSSPSFERMVSGVRLNPSEAVKVGHVQETPLDYEQSVILDIEQPVPERLEERYEPDGTSVAALAEHGPAGTAEVRDQGRAKFAPEERGPVVAEPEFVVATKDGLVQKDLDDLDGTYTGAAERLRERPDRNELQIVRKEEAMVPA